MTRRLFTRRFYTERSSIEPSKTLFFEEALANFVNRNSLDFEEVTILKANARKGQQCLILLYWAETELE